MNLFNFDYVQEPINNLDGTKSRFGVVFGEGGKVIHTKKDTYSIIPTASLSVLGNTFKEKGYEVSAFVNKHGEAIGVNITLGNRANNLGDREYRALITVPNNGGGKGYLSMKVVRLVCMNGMVHTLGDSKSVVKIPHTMDYPFSLKLMQNSLEQFELIIKSIEEREIELDSLEIDKDVAMYELNKWYFNNEMPTEHKKDYYSLDSFRLALATEPETIKSIERINELRAAFNRELGYNEELGLKLSMFTVFATVTNYLSRRIEKSKSSAPEEVQYQRQASKLISFV